jgi:DNA mismatch repair protein MSH3
VSLHAGQGKELKTCRLNVARLANVPKSVIEVAAVKSRELEADIKRRKLGKM